MNSKLIIAKAKDQIPNAPMTHMLDQLFHICVSACYISLSSYLLRREFPENEYVLFVGQYKKEKVEDNLNEIVKKIFSRNTRKLAFTL